MWLGLEPWGLEAKIQALKPERGGRRMRRRRNFPICVREKGHKRGLIKQPTADKAGCRFATKNRLIRLLI